MSHAVPPQHAAGDVGAEHEETGGGLLHHLNARLGVHVVRQVFVEDDQRPQELVVHCMEHAHLIRIYYTCKLHHLFGYWLCMCVCKVLGF